MELVAILWLGLLIAFVVVEAACPIHLVSIWFAAGSLAALVVYWLHSSLALYQEVSEPPRHRHQYRLRHRQHRYCHLCHR